MANDRTWRGHPRHTRPLRDVAGPCVLVIFEDSTASVDALGQGVEAAEELQAALDIVATINPDRWSSAFARSSEIPIDGDERAVEAALEQRLLRALQDVPKSISVSWRIVRSRRAEILREVSDRDRYSLVLPRASQRRGVFRLTRVLRGS